MSQKNRYVTHIKYSCGLKCHLLLFVFVFAIHCFVSLFSGSCWVAGISSTLFTQTHLSTMALSCCFPQGLAEMSHVPVVYQGQTTRPWGKGLQWLPLEWGWLLGLPLATKLLHWCASLTEDLGATGGCWTIWCKEHVSHCPFPHPSPRPQCYDEHKWFPLSCLPRSTRSIIVRVTLRNIQWSFNVYQWRTWSSEWLNHLLKVIQPGFKCRSGWFRTLSLTMESHSSLLCDRHTLLMSHFALPLSLCPSTAQL